MLFRCQPGYEVFLEKELKDSGLITLEKGEGWLRTDALATLEWEHLCFPHLSLLGENELTGDSVNALASRILDWFLGSARDERFEVSWSLRFEAAAGLDGLGRRADAVEKEFSEQLRKRLSRVSKLATSDLPRAQGPVRGLYVFFADFRRVFVAREWILFGQRRMADDPLAPSRSYLKVEEAYGILGREPDAEDTVADLGAAPGGWSFSAAKRRARVVAVDNGPLKGGALGHMLIDHRKSDAFTFRPEPTERFDWLFCDLVEEPHHVLHNVLEQWIQNAWCRRFIVNLKFGRVDPIALLREVRQSPVVGSQTNQLRIRHLFHDREEFTITGETKR